MTSIFYACVLKSGGVYGPEWVKKLHRQLKRPLICLTDRPNSIPHPIITIPLSVPSLTGWWAKLELFRPGIFRGRIIYIDLDSFVIGDPWPLENLSGGPWFHEDGQMRGTLSTAVMVWDAGTMDWVWGDVLLYGKELFKREFAPSAPNSVMNDQVALEEMYRRRFANKVHRATSYVEGIKPFQLLSKALPGYVVQSRDVKRKEPTGECIVTFCGDTKPNAAGGWIQKKWEAL